MRINVDLKIQFAQHWNSTTPRTLSGKMVSRPQKLKIFNIFSFTWKSAALNNKKNSKCKRGDFIMLSRNSTKLQKHILQGHIHVTRQKRKCIVETSFWNPYPRKKWISSKSKELLLNDVLLSFKENEVHPTKKEDKSGHTYLLLIFACTLRMGIAWVHWEPYSCARNLRSFTRNFLLEFIVLEISSLSPEVVPHDFKILYSFAEV